MGSALAPGAFLLDVEGTTTPIDFVYKTLFPFARKHAREYLEKHTSRPEVQRDLETLRQEHDLDRAHGLNPPAWRNDSPGSLVFSALRYIEWLMDRDRKSTPLKSLQGQVWEAGYTSGDLRAEVYADVPRSFERWHQQGKMIAIFSSGSVLAQRLLFAHTTAGDLTPFIKEYFDTTIGAKKDPKSYAAISAKMGVPAAQVLFVSDMTPELDAARAAGMPTALCVREGPAGQHEPRESAHPVIRTFDGIQP